MKKLTLSLSTIALITGSILNATDLTNSSFSNYHINSNLGLKPILPIHKVNEVDYNDFGLSNVLMPGPNHRTQWYLRFYMTPEIYNLMSLVVQSVRTMTDPAFHFWQLFLGAEGKSGRYQDWSKAINQYNEIIQHKEREYPVHLDFNQIFKNWLVQNWTYFSDTFLGKNFITNIYPFYHFPSVLSPEKRQQLLEEYWRKQGVVMNIPFTYNSIDTEWTIDRSNFRMFPQMHRISSFYYYYSSKGRRPPIVKIPNPTSLQQVDASTIATSIYSSFINAINPPEELDEGWYSIFQDSLNNKIIYQASLRQPTYIDINFKSRPNSPLMPDFSFKIGFYLEN